MLLDTIWWSLMINYYKVQFTNDWHELVRGVENMAEMISETNKVTPPAPYHIKLVKKKKWYIAKKKRKKK